MSPAAGPRPAAAGGQAPAVEVIGARKTYPDGTRALEAVDLRIAQHEFVTLLGPSGCGKTTLLKIIAGLLAPSAGSVRLWHHPVAELAGTGRRLDFVFQAPTLMPWAQVHANVRLPLDLAGVERARARPRVDAALRLVGLEAFAGALPHALSGGMQMRVSIARSLVTEPELLLMDEPFGALDEITRQRLDGDLLELWRARGLTIVYVTHSIQEAVFLSNRVVVMAARPGRVLEELRVEEPYPRTPEFHLSPRFAAYAQRLQRSLLQASAGAEQAL